ncbi:MAG: HEAT repeat domain-containing protein [Syntrophobacteraceae bacterium]
MSSPDDINRLIRELESLNTGKHAADRLVECGPSAVEPLRRFLLEGIPRKIFQPRFWAVAALARLGAKDVLLEYLLQIREIPDPEDRFGEEAVESAAARFLSAWPGEDVYQSLLKLSERRMLLGLIDALAEFRRAEAIPYLERALEDDFYRSAAEEAFLKIGAASFGALASSAVTPRPSFVMETPSSLHRRRSAVRLLYKIGMPPEYWQTLRELIHDPDEELFVHTSKLGTRIASKEDRAIIARRVMKLLSSAAWYLQEDIEEILVMLGSDAAADIEEEISRRMKQPEEARVADIRLRSLIRVWRRLK